MAQKTTLSTIGLPTRLWGSFAGKSFSDYVWYPRGATFTYTAANHSGRSMYFEVDFLATSGVVEADLYDITASAAVEGSAHSTASATLVTLRSGALTLTGGHVYRVRFGKSGFDSGEAWGAKVIGI